jgi:soluble lytic murein transglycosylase
MNRSAADKEAALNMSYMVKHLISASPLILCCLGAAQIANAQQVRFEPGVGSGTARPAAAPNAGGYMPQAIPQNLWDPSEGNIPQAIQRWQALNRSQNYSFGEYASFLIMYPDWPDSDAMRKNAEQAIDLRNYSPSQAVAYFDRLPPLTNAGRAKYAIALAASGNSTKAKEWGRQAWREGPLTDDDEARISQLMAGQLSAADHDARIEKLLWAGGTTAAARILSYASPARQPVFSAWIASKTNAPDAASRFAQVANSADAGLLIDRANRLRSSGSTYAARELLANRGTLPKAPASPKDWYKALLSHASAAASEGQHSLAYQIASKLEDGIPSGASVADQDLSTRDNYTSLAWLAGQMALQKLGRPSDAIRMFKLYGDAAKTPQTKSKGYYWAAKAASRAGNKAQAGQYLNDASQYFDYFYGQLALEALGRPLPAINAKPTLPTVATKSGAPARYIAARIAPKYSSWKDQSSFLRAIANSAETEQDFLNAISLSKAIGRPDLAVMAGRNARVEGVSTIIGYAFPIIDVPIEQDDNWTMIHAISRQESQFDRAAVSHAGARGMMQLMPGTARETAGKIAMSYRPDALTTDITYNVHLGSTYFKSMLRYFGGSYPLAVAAYNAGPGNVNKWLRANGDPRSGSIGMIEWIEAIPIYETKNYVQRVLENAVMYDQLNSGRANFKGPNPLSSYLGKSTPG